MQQIILLVVASQLAGVYSILAKIKLENLLRDVIHLKDLYFLIPFVVELDRDLQQDFMKI